MNGGLFNLIYLFCEIVKLPQNYQTITFSKVRMSSEVKVIFLLEMYIFLFCLC